MPSLALEEPIRALAVTYTELSLHLYKKERFSTANAKSDVFFFCGALQFPLIVLYSIVINNSALTLPVQRRLFQMPDFSHDLLFSLSV